MMYAGYKKLGLFLGTFLSAFLLIFGLGTIALSLFPAFYKLWLRSPIYQPQLTIAEARSEEFLDIDSIPAKQLFPPLPNAQLTYQGDELLIPSIGVTVPVATSPSIQDADVIKTLDKGAALYPNGILPGRLGNAFIAAHSTGNPWQGKYRFAFLRINEVNIGNEIHIDFAGSRYTYRVVTKEIVKPDPNFQIVSDRPVPTLTLMACWPLWSTDKRMLLKGELINITKLTPQPA